MGVGLYSTKPSRMSTLNELKNTFSGLLLGGVNSIKKREGQRFHGKQWQRIVVFQVNVLVCKLALEKLCPN